MRELKRKHNGSEADKKRKKQQEIIDNMHNLIVAEELTRTRRPIIKRLIKDEKQSNVSCYYGCHIVRVDHKNVLDFKGKHR